MTGSATTKGGTEKPRASLDSEREIGSETILQDILIVVENGGRGGRINATRFSPSEIGDISACITTISDPIDKRRVQGDSTHQIGPKLTLHCSD